MKWEDAALKVLKSTFGNGIFSTRDAVRVLNKEKGFSEGTVYRVLHDLCKRGLAERLGRGIFRVSKVVELKANVTISAKPAVELIPGPFAKAIGLLRNKGIEFMITGGSSLYRFFHHLPRRLIHLIYVEKGAGEVTTTLLREVGLRALLNPSRDEVNVALENFPERDVFVVREFSELLGNVNGAASVERALVDLYFESTRGRIPFPEEEVGRILLKVLRTEHISLSRLFMLASRRGIREEMEIIAKVAQPELSIKVRKANKHVEKVLMAMEAFG